MVGVRIFKQEAFDLAVKRKRLLNLDSGKVEWLTP